LRQNKLISIFSCKTHSVLLYFWLIFTGNDSWWCQFDFIWEILFYLINVFLFPLAVHPNRCCIWQHYFWLYSTSCSLLLTDGFVSVVLFYYLGKYGWSFFYFPWFLSLFNILYRWAVLNSLWMSTFANYRKSRKSAKRMLFIYVGIILIEVAGNTSSHLSNNFIIHFKKIH
jgi:hypothetical protein